MPGPQGLITHQAERGRQRESGAAVGGHGVEQRIALGLVLNTALNGDDRRGGLARQRLEARRQNLRAGKGASNSCQQREFAAGNV